MTDLELVFLNDGLACHFFCFFIKFFSDKLRNSIVVCSRVISSGGTNVVFNYDINRVSLIIVFFKKDLSLLKFVLYEQKQKIRKFGILRIKLQVSCYEAEQFLTMWTHSILSSQLWFSLTSAVNL